MEKIVVNTRDCQVEFDDVREAARFCHLLHLKGDEAESMREKIVALGNVIEDLQFRLSDARQKLTERGPVLRLAKDSTPEQIREAYRVAEESGGATIIVEPVHHEEYARIVPEHVGER